MVPMEVKTTGGRNCLNLIPSGNVSEAATATVCVWGGDATELVQRPQLP